MKNFNLKFLLNVILITCCVIQSVAQREWNLGPYTYVHDPKASLEQKSLLHMATIGSYESHSKVGGIVFEQTMQLNDKIRSVAITYDGQARDGSRLVVRVNDSVDFHPVIFDWQIVPTAHFAEDSHHNSLISVFEHSSISYHPVLIDQLLGIRALQADELPFMAEKYAGAQNDRESISYGNGLTTLMKYDRVEVKGAGEASLSADLRARGRAVALEFGKLIQTKAWGANQSMLTDHKIQITPSITGGKFTLQGDPYFMVTRLNESRATVTILWPRLDDRQELEQSSKYFKNINPYVFQSMKCLSNYSALFRYVKINDPEAWSKFMTSLPGLDQTFPNVQTPDSQK